MSDVSTWHPLDADNIAPPPDGWPEFMMPSMVNNAGRMMMGAVRRMYDDMVAGSLALPYLPIAGGTVTGSVTVNGALSGGSITSSSTIYSANTISTGGALSAAGNVSGSSISTVGNLSANGITANSIGSNGQIHAAYYDMAGLALARHSGGATILHDGASQPVMYLDSNGTDTFTNSTYRFNNRANTVNFVNIDSNGLVVSTGFISCSGGAVLGGLTCNGNGAVTGTLAVGTSVAVGQCRLVTDGIRYFNSTTSIGFLRNPAPDLNTNVYYDGAYIYTINVASSDERLKQNILPSQIDALALIRQLDTISYDMRERHFQCGVRGQQLDALMPDAVFKGPPEGEGVPIGDLIQVNSLTLSTYLLRALQQLADKVDALQGGAA